MTDTIENDIDWEALEKDFDGGNFNGGDGGDDGGDDGNWDDDYEFDPNWHPIKISLAVGALILAESVTTTGVIERDPYWTVAGSIGLIIIGGYLIEKFHEKYRFIKRSKDDDAAVEYTDLSE